jgi:hypothetical protein
MGMPSFVGSKAEVMLESFRWEIGALPAAKKSKRNNGFYFL